MTDNYSPTPEEINFAARNTPVTFPVDEPEQPVTTETPWPEPLADEAFHGLAGDIVRTIEPHSESDPAAILVQLLVAFGNAIGRSAHFRVERTKHFMNLFVVLVGLTSRGRKGTSFDWVKDSFERADPDYVCRIKTGVSSGEGLIWVVRDGTVDKDGNTNDEGVADKRLLAIEPEYASLFAVMARSGNTVSPLVRLCWDSGALETLTKNSPAKATGAHVSLIGHISQHELREQLGATQAANGYANRHLFVCAKRSKLLPKGGSLKGSEFNRHILRLKTALDAAKATGDMSRDDEADGIWCEVYPALTADKPGMFGAVVARAEAQVLRLSCLYALLDCTPVVRSEHIMAALEVWNYCESSARYVWADRLGDPVADRILEELLSTPEGLSGTDIQNLFERHQKKAKLDVATKLLVDSGKARWEKVKTGGADRKILRAVGA